MNADGKPVGVYPGAQCAASAVWFWGRAGDKQETDEDSDASVCSA